ncbi:7690_t:CDS:2 [Gigaspora rosea]|nr:7690_t:CDS:2 [Gigaspora rosea]
MSTISLSDLLYFRYIWRSSAIFIHENFISANNAFDLCWNAKQDDAASSYTITT